MEHKVTVWLVLNFMSGVLPESKLPLLSTKNQDLIVSSLYPSLLSYFSFRLQFKTLTAFGASGRPGPDAQFNSLVSEGASEKGEHTW